MTKYEFTSSTNPLIPVGTQLPIVFPEDLAVGQEVTLLLEKCICTQNTEVLQFRREGNGDDDLGAVYSLVKVHEESVNVYPRKVTVGTLDDLRINHEIDIFFGTKTFMISPTERVTRAHGITVEAFYEFIKAEWDKVQVLTPEPFPLEYTEGNLILWGEWGFSDGTPMFLKDGSWTRKIQLENGLVKTL
jgi:hypothetical protein